MQLRQPNMVKVTQLFLQAQLLSQDEQSPDTIPLSKLKAALKAIALKLGSGGGSKQPLHTTSYLISCDLSTGLQWGKMAVEQTLIQSSYLQLGEIETLTTEVLRKVHCMLQGRRKDF